MIRDIFKNLLYRPFNLTKMKGSMPMPYKHNQNRQHKFEKTRYQIIDFGCIDYLSKNQISLYLTQTLHEMGRSGQ